MNKAQSFLAGLLMITAVTPPYAAAASQFDSSANSNFGKLMVLLNGHHPRLDLSPKSALPCFHFTFGLSGPQPSNKSDESFTEIRVVRNRLAYAAVLYFTDGPCFYSTSNGSHSIVAMVTPSTPSSVLIAKDASIYCAGLLTNMDDKTLNIPGGTTYWFGVQDGKPRYPISLRIFGFVRNKLHMAHEVKFLSSVAPKLSLWWPNPEIHAEDNVVATFNLSGGVNFPLKQLTLTMRRGNSVVGTGWISHIGPGLGRSGPIIHRITGLQSRMALPWLQCKPTEIFREFRRFANQKQKPPPPSRSFFTLRDRFLKWTSAPDAARAHVTRPGR
jgi:hypothetical protein